MPFKVWVTKHRYFSSMKFFATLLRLRHLVLAHLFVVLLTRNGDFHKHAIKTFINVPEVPKVLKKHYFALPRMRLLGMSSLPKFYPKGLFSSVW